MGYEDAYTYILTPWGENMPDRSEPKRTDTSLEKQLSELKELYDKGLIDKEEYDAKRKKILNLNP